MPVENPDSKGAQGKKREGPTAEEIAQFEERVKILITLFEQYFAGVLRVPPLTERDRLLFFVRRTSPGMIRTTALRYRLQAAFDKFNAYYRRWETNLKKIEDGTFQRQLFKAKLKEEETAPVSPNVGSPAAAPSAMRGNPASGALPPAIQRLYEVYIEARARCGLSNEGVSPAKIFELVKARQEKLRSEYPGKKIAFRIEIKDNTPVIKATVKDE